jgi:hypothetical protein
MEGIDKWKGEFKLIENNPSFNLNRPHPLQLL